MPVCPSYLTRRLNRNMRRLCCVGPVNLAGPHASGAVAGGSEP